VLLSIYQHELLPVRTSLPAPLASSLDSEHGKETIFPHSESCIQPRSSFA